MGSDDRFLRFRRIVAALLAITLIGSAVFLLIVKRPPPPIKIGLLDALTGPLGVNGSAVKDATVFAVEEINAAGGIRGRKIEPVFYDYASDSERAATGAEALITNSHVDAIFGCWTSSSRKSAREVVEEHRNLLFYPVQYEGLEESRNVIYTGATPNEQIIPAVKWAFDNLGKSFFLVGSDYVFPHAANAIISDEVHALRGEIAGEAYAQLDATDFSAIIEKILAAKPAVILNTINGDANVAFFRALRAHGITPDKIPTISFSFGENYLAALRDIPMDGDYASGNYFQSISTETNRDFLARFRTRFGSKRVVDDPMVSAYASVKLWAQAVDDADSSEPEEVRRAILHQTCDSPGGLFYVDPDTRNTWNIVRLARIERGQFRVVWDSEFPVRPVLFPFFHTRHHWEEFLDELYKGWGNAWIAPKQ